MKEKLKLDATNNHVKEPEIEEKKQTSKIRKPKDINKQSKSKLKKSHKS